jgi:hypothetical protein
MNNREVQKTFTAALGESLSMDNDNPKLTGLAEVQHTLAELSRLSNRVAELEKAVCETEGKHSTEQHRADALARENKLLLGALSDLVNAFAKKVDVETTRWRMPYEHPLSAYDRAVDVLASITKENK